jgi:transposase
MLAIPHSVRIHLAVEPVDMRKSFNGLWSAVSECLQEYPRSGALFVFINKNRTRLKLLYWDGTGVWVLAKRLEEGRFSWPAPSQAKVKLTLTPEALALR